MRKIKFPFVGGMDRERRRYIIVYLVTLAVSAAFIFVGQRIAAKGTPSTPTYGSELIMQAKVISVGEVTTETISLSGQELVSAKTVFKARITQGENKGLELDALHVDDPLSPYRVRPVRKGDNVFIQYAPGDNEEARWVLQDYRRTDGLIGLGIFIMALLLLFGRSKGIHTIVSLTFTCMAIFVVFIPSILSGKNIYVWSIIVGVFIIAMTILIVNGPGQKSLCSGVGCLFGFLASGLMSVVMNMVLGLTGLVDEDAVLLLYLSPDNPIDMNAIIFAAVTVGALGAIMDVAISISSALYEVHVTDPGLEAKDIFRSGMNIGRDIIGTMSNTLILAYIGSCLSLVVLLTAYNDNLMILLNKEMIVVEILQALVGVAGLLMVIPLTTLVCSAVYTRKQNEQKA